MDLYVQFAFTHPLEIRN